MLPLPATRWSGQQELIVHQLHDWLWCLKVKAGQAQLEEFATLPTASKAHRKFALPVS